MKRLPLLLKSVRLEIKEGGFPLKMGAILSKGRGEFWSPGDAAHVKGRVGDDRAVPVCIGF
jgi:hypothetical protein